MDKAEIASRLHEVGELLEILGENPFKIRAHYNAARVIESLDEDIQSLIDAGQLTSIKGIGKGIADKIVELYNTGELKELAELHSRTPDGVIEILKIPGLGPKKVRTIWEKLGVTTIGELEYACNENRLMELQGFGARSQANILKGIEVVRKFAGRRLLPEGLKAAEATLEWIVKEKSVIRASIAGSARRARETVKDVDIVASSNSPEKVMARFVKMDEVADVIGHGSTKSSVRLGSGMQVDLRVVTDEQYPFALHHFTGSREHNTLIRGLARARGMKLNEYRLSKGEKLIPCKSEEEIFAAMGLAHIPPELREGLGEIDDAASSIEPELVEPKDIKGIFHCHTTYSDGLETVEAMANACKEMGYEYLGVSDHSQSAPYAGGMSEATLLKQIDEIDGLNEKLKGFRLFKGVESDILTDGSLDYSDKILGKLDFVIASIHSGFHMDEKKMTQRIVKAIENPNTAMLGHPTGRLLLSREGYPVDMGKVIKSCAKHGVIIEINANPHRLDIDWRQIRGARMEGAQVCVNPDAHRIAGLDHTKYGVMIARKGGCEKKDVFNTLDLADMTDKLIDMKGMKR